MELFFNGDPESTLFNGFAHESAINLPYNKDYELTEKDFSIGLTRLIKKAFTQNSVAYFKVPNIFYVNLRCRPTQVIGIRMLRVGH